MSLDSAQLRILSRLLQGLGAVEAYLVAGAAPMAAHALRYVQQDLATLLGTLDADDAHGELERVLETVREAERRASEPDLRPALAASIARAR